MRATISLLRNGFEEEAVTFGHPRARVSAGGQSPLWVIRVGLSVCRRLPVYTKQQTLPGIYW
jgi:hypothetical protein